MKFRKVLFITILLLSCFCFMSSPLHASTKKTDSFDILYLLSDDLESLLDYKEELEVLLGEQVAAKLKLVARGNQFGIIYDRSGTALSAGRIVVRQNEILRRAGFGEAVAVKNMGAQELYNVSYGLGPNLDELKRRYDLIYSYLGSDVGRNLFIEKTDYGNYSLIYQRRGDKGSTLAIAKKHGKLLASKKISTSISLVDNNELIYGESSLLDDSGSEAGENGQETPVVQLVSISVPPTLSVPPPAPVSPPVSPSIPEIVLLQADNSKRPVESAKQQSRKGVSRNGDDTLLEQYLEGVIKDLRRVGKVGSDEMTGWLVYDLTRGESLVDINANQAFQAASMIKPFVALAFFHKVKEGKIIYGSKSRAKLEAMIQRSNNSATNWAMKNAGGPANVQKILSRYYGHIFKSTVISEYIPAGGRTYKNRASPEDYGRFLSALWRKELPYGKEIRRLMALPGRDRIYHGTPIPQGTLVYNKTGSTAHLCGDMGILAPRGKDGQRYPYAFVGIIEKRSRSSNYGHWKMERSNVIRKVSALVYDAMRKKYDLL